MITNQNGYTLLEVLLAVTLLGVVVAAVSTNFQAGLFSYRKGIAKGDLLQIARGGLGLINADIGNMVPILDEHMDFKTTSFSFITAAGPSNTRFERIRYYLEKGDLIRKAVPYPENKESKEYKETEKAKSIAIIKGIKMAEFQFRLNEKWQKDIEKPEYLPEAVKLLFHLEHRREDAVFKTTYHFPYGE